MREKPVVGYYIHPQREVDMPDTPLTAMIFIACEAAGLNPILFEAVSGSEQAQLLDESIRVSQVLAKEGAKAHKARDIGHLISDKWRTYRCFHRHVIPDDFYPDVKSIK